MKQMKFSEAMSLGAMLHIQGTACLWQCDYNGGIIRTCAWGAALEAIGIPMRNGQKRANRKRIPTTWQILAKQRVPCPAGTSCLPHNKANTTTIGRLIEHLNDHHRWTREQIADWLETLEPVTSPVETTTTCCASQ
jgi:hypothetical protein